MDFSKNGIVKKQHQVKSMSKRLSTKIRIGVLRVLLVMVVCVAITGCFLLAGALKGLLDNMPDITNINLTPEGYTSFTYYSDGTVAQRFAGAQANRIYVTLEQLPPKVYQCFVAIEDERFYDHYGIDIKGIFRAVASVAKSRSLKFGASTITQQVLKNTLFSGGNEKNNYDKIKRKLQEQFLAIQLEDMYTKDQILEVYINYVNLGNGSFGLQTAAQNYFGKDAAKLTMSEAAVIASIALSPVNQNPINYPEENARRRLSCLEIMLQLGFCTEEEYDEAVNDDVYARIKELNEAKGEQAMYSFSYYTDSVFTAVRRDLQEKLGMTSEQAEDMIYRGGIRIYTPQDREIQGIVDKYYTDESNFPTIKEGSYYALDVNYAISVQLEDDSWIHYHLKDFIEHFKDYNDTGGIYFHSGRGKMGISEYCRDRDDLLAKLEEFEEYIITEDVKTVSRYPATLETSVKLQPQSSMTIIDQATGHVVAIYGGRGTKSGARELNRAETSRRQVGSTFKVLASFLPALDSAGLTLGSVFDDTEYFYPGTEEKVRNWYTTGYRGLSPLRAGIYDSMNIIACKTIDYVTPQVAFSYLRKMGFTSLVESKKGEDGRIYSDIGSALALGGLTNGVTNLELTAAYAAIANKGAYMEPVFYTKVLDMNGNVLLDNTKEPVQIFKASTAYLLTDAMLDVVRIGTASSRIRFKNYNMTIAGKTGTTTSDYDFWFVGFTPYYTAGIWTGYDINFKQTDAKLKSYHQDLWRNIMEEIHATRQLANKAFEKPDTIITERICTKCGNLAIPGICDKAEMHPLSKYGPVRDEMFVKGFAPYQKCTCHQVFKRCNVSKKLAGPHCPADEVSDYVYLLKEETNGIETWDTPFIYPRGDDIYCDYHAYVEPPVVDDQGYGEVAQ